MPADESNSGAVCSASQDIAPSKKTPTRGARRRWPIGWACFTVGFATRWDISLPILRRQKPMIQRHTPMALRNESESLSLFLSQLSPGLSVLSVPSQDGTGRTPAASHARGRLALLLHHQLVPARRISSSTATRADAHAACWVRPTIVALTLSFSPVRQAGHKEGRPVSSPETSNGYSWDGILPAGRERGAQDISVAMWSAHACGITILPFCLLSVCLHRLIRVSRIPSNVLLARMSSPRPLFNR
jgi:hypothetical protein